MISSSQPIATVYCERVMINSDQSHHNHQDLHKPRIKFSINPNSTHSEQYYMHSPTSPQTESTGPFETAILCPDIDFDFAEFRAHSLSRRRYNRKGWHYLAFMDMLSSLVVSPDTKKIIIQKILDGARKPIANMRDVFEVRGEKFNLKVSIKLHVLTVHTYENEDIGVDDGVDGRFSCMVPTAEEAIESLERIMVEEETKERQCSICLENYAGKCEVRRLGCLHVFHGHCLRAWLQTSHYCPLCRFPLPVSDSSR